MTKVRACYRTSDGKVFDLLQEAEARQAELDASTWYLNHKLHGNYAGSYVELDDLLDWLREHKQTILRLL